MFKVWYRARCFDRPVGPWRATTGEVTQDLIENGLGSFDECGCFFVTVPGSIERIGEWMDFEAARAIERAKGRSRDQPR